MSREPHPLWVPVRQILWDDWDPIGVKDIAPEDEYDGYVWPVISKISRGETADQIADYLDRASNEHMGRPLPRDVNLALAVRLVALKSSENS